MANKEGAENIDSEETQIRYLNNTISYFKMLKSAEEIKVPPYKLELANTLKDFDLFFLKTRVILSIGGIIGSFLLLFILFSNIYNDFGSIRISPALIAYLYLIFIVVFFSLRIFKRSIFELKIIQDEIEE